MPSSLRALGVVVLGSVVAASCGGGGAGGAGNGGDGGAAGSGSGGSGGSTGGSSGGSSGIAGNSASGRGGATGTGGMSGSQGGDATGTGGSAAGTGGGAGDGGNGGAGGRGGAGTMGIGGTSGSAGGATAGVGGRGGSAGNGTAGGGGRGGATGGTGGGGGTTSCAGHAVSLSANGTGQASDAAYAHVELNLGSDLPIGNTPRTFEFWAYIKTTDWVGEKNEVYYYGGSANAAAFGLDFGTNPVPNTTNHATLNPITGGGFNDDSTNDLGINSSTDQWVHIAMVWNGTNVITYVNGLPKITTAGSNVTALATTSSAVIIGCNPTNNSCFNGLFDELRIWNIARTPTQIHDSYNKPVVGNEAGLVGYWKFDETSGTTTADLVSTTGHTAHNGTLKAMAAAQNPTFVVPPAPLPLVCP
jgi:hypothetical protein